MAGKYFDIPWAEAGDKTAIPDASQPSGDVSYSEGWTSDYELDQVTEPTAKDVERQKENQLKFDVTELLKEVQQNGLPVYDVNYNYLVGAYTLASDGILYQALIANGPLSTVRDPIGDTTGSWISSRGDLRNYISSFDFTPGDYVKGSDGNLYLCAANNGPSTFPVDPVIGARTFWVPVKSDVGNWDNSFVYIASPSNDYAKGVDGILYLALTDSGPGTSVGVVNPVGDTTGAWRFTGASAGLKTTYLTASDPAWAPDALTRTIRVTVTGGGGGGGGIDSGGITPGGGGGGGAGGTAIYTFNRPFAASYAVIVGSGGAGGIGDIDSVGGVGFGSLFTEGATVVTGNGGMGGSTGVRDNAASLVFFNGGAGGSPQNGDIDIFGGAGTPTLMQGLSFGNIGGGGGSIYGENMAPNNVSSIPIGAGGSPKVNGSSLAFTGQDGGDGIVVIEEFF